MLDTSKLIHKASNHPVHIINDEKILSPSSFIPFCQFGTEMKLMGVKNTNFTVPICNSFKDYILNDQLCYQVDLNNFESSFSSKSMKFGLMFLVDNNEDRQFSWKTLNKTVLTDDKEWQIKEEIAEQTFTIHIGTLGLII